LTTQAAAKIVPALRVVTEKAPLCVAYMDVGQGREQDAEALLVAYLEQLQNAGSVFERKPQWGEIHGCISQKALLVP